MAEEDAKLVLKTLSGDKGAFGELYDRYAALVRSISYDNTGDYSRAQDLAQEVFLRAYGKLAQLKKPESFGPWLVSMARNVGREYRRGRFRDRLKLVGLEPQEEIAVESLQEQGRVALLEEAIGKLSEDERLALHTYYLQGKDVEQTRKVMNTSRSRLYRLLAHGKAKLEEYIREKEEQDKTR